MSFLKAVVSLLILSMLGSGGAGRASAQESRTEIVHREGRNLSVERAGEARSYRPDRLLVRFRPGRAASFLPGTQGGRALPGAPGLFLVPTPPGLSVEEAVERYAKHPEVAFAEPDYVATLEAVPGDPRWSEQWDMTKISTPAAWDVHTDSSGVIVAVLDSGIDFAHPDLQANLWTDPLDGSHGFTCAGGAVTPGGLDDNGHGTHVAGTIGAAGNNGLGIAGVNWSVQLLSLKAFNQYGTGKTSDIVVCLDKIVELRQRGFDIRVSNHSWTTSAYSQALQEAFTRVAEAGVLQVCASGNSNFDLDFTPVYPAAFSGRSILAVAATDASDLAASFSSFGHVEVDLAAPGVDVLSTVPSGTCTHCDPSGYKLLSGTSMATPHVTGVAAALFQRNPLLTAAEARDVLLDPASFDRLTTISLLADSTTRGRLNFSKVLANPLATTPRLNGFPTVSAPSRIVRSAGSPVTLSATASDPDGDALQYQWGRPLGSYLYGAMSNQVFGPGWFFPSAVSANPYTFTAPSLGLTSSVEYKALVNDGRGGSAASRTWVSVLASPTAGQPPSGTITVTPESGPSGTVVTIGYSGADPEGGPLFWDVTSGSFATCCFSSTSLTYTYTLYTGVHRIRGQSIDREMQLSPVSSTVVRIGGATGEPPVADLRLDVSSGPAPLTVHYDASGSYDPDGGGPLTFYIECEPVSGFLSPKPPTGTCVFDTPGPRAIYFTVYDAQYYGDQLRGYVMVTPPLPPDVTPPAVQITAPASGAPLKGVVTVNATASDEVGVTRVEIYRDSGVLLGTDTIEPYSVTWDTANSALGAHTLQARAYDQAGNASPPASINVTVLEAIPPSVSITSPVNGGTVAKNSTTTVSASAADNVGVARVEIYVGSTLLCTDTASPYSCAWSVPKGTGIRYSLQARAYDTSDNMTSSAVVQVTSR